MMRMFNIFLMLIFLLLVVTYGDKTEYIIEVNADKQGVQISPILYGLFFEDINYAADGGIYANLIQNGSFEFYNKFTDNKFYAWEKLFSKDSQGTVSIESSDPLNKNNLNYLHIHVDNPGVDGLGVENKGFDGMFFIQDDEYYFSMFSRAKNFKGTVRILLVNENEEVLDSRDLQISSENWEKYEVTLVPSKTTEKGMLVIKVMGPGDLYIDMVSLFPRNAWKGILRNDLVKFLKDFKPGFLRFPGGCIVEGDSIGNMYRWKNTIGKPEERKLTYNLWYSQRYPYYHQSFGLGFFEYFLLSEYLGAEPVPVLNAGMTCQARGATYIPLSKLNEFVQDALDLVEFANGSPQTVWGSKRREMGHPEPFNLKMISIGNEQWGAPYFERYPYFHLALKNKFSDLKLIGCVGPAPDDENYLNAMDWLRRLSPSERPDIIDEHIYKSPAWFYQNIHRYDNYDRNMPKVFIGELAAHDYSRLNSLRSALAEASYLTAIEENSDIVKMVSYAPLFGKFGYTQWQPNFIWFTNSLAYGSVNYYVWRLFSQNLGDYTVYSHLFKRDGEIFDFSGYIGLGSLGNTFFKDFSLLDSKGGIIYKDLFTNLNNWKILSGKFSVNKGILNSSNVEEPSLIYLKTKSLKGKYSINFKVMFKNFNDKFIIYNFLKDSKNYVAWYIDSNYAYAKLTYDGVDYQLTPFYRTNLRSNEWYNVKMVVEGNRMKLYIKNSDFLSKDEPDFVIEVNPKLGPIYLTTSIDKETSDLIIKVVNPSSEEVNCLIKLEGLKYIHPKALVSWINGSPRDENNIANPQKLIPNSKLINVSKEFNYRFIPYSVTIIRIRTKPTDFPKPTVFSIRSSKNYLKVGDTLRLIVEAGLMSDGTNIDMSSALVYFEVDQKDTAEFIYDPVTGLYDILLLKKAPKDNRLKIWGKVSINGFEIVSNILELIVE
ncbi:alpha-L-arabinofuranosidase C-terminal domain-containing protein [Dictyoglomus thermophilum]|uniref:non-reducing end alpha-L-arabinofuranosidase n=1 Tax=Dictyoglomus thermophilum (strain ATCC 35947 / DSM 3960 / H-6-12) TaxID=309799 RepID=B5YAG8_DICT6|nr:alpha-L-arabinofuranosidase C-terminal domain-containing protein [Dictyoglomus thermophilum]ACI19869.1 arabinosidase [Dictyoglomus thermophilum H-6-12]